MREILVPTTFADDWKADELCDSVLDLIDENEQCPDCGQLIGLCECEDDDDA